MQLSTFLSLCFLIKHEYLLAKIEFVNSRAK